MVQEYVEEESLQVLPTDDEFCQAVDASIHQANTAAMEPFERRLVELANACPIPLGATLDHSPLGASLAKRPPQKRKADRSMDLNVFESLKKAFIAPEPSADHSPQDLPEPLLSNDVDSVDEAGRPALGAPRP
ncbi:hypothetical protein NDU88_005860 [Pleurodeles waltl]|uniref:Uncharacterized protein n=1 Tax=Pleurodeles waltl TaxID=8319 RepID=A0AAV7PLN6_PLEWA|nr:hypothetical protein NDU88_005860 [Pleurodeles waltl]